MWQTDCVLRWSVFKHQKVQFDKKADSYPYCVGGCVLKLALLYHGPYRILEVRSNASL